ncbi:Proline-rich cell wall-like protein [Quillaja saponaria]|uniref:Proline-rich cell wall-like protein n=1 Tax=Quillaja saponaria TaxID=32244 RepID=A0AAD7LJJ7_QUISA|nr:Proline-rich cell wall-like protein [Quillaja saponaria]
MFRPATSSSSSPASHPMYGPSLYPKVSQPGNDGVPSVGRPSLHHQTSSPSSCSGLGIRVAIIPEYRITLPPNISPHIGEIPRSNFQFNFEFERKVLAEIEKESPNWSRLGLENLPSKASESTPSMGSTADSIVSKYVALGLSREAVPIAVVNYGDDPSKVREFVNGYTILREMGFSSSSVCEALLMNDNDTDKALAYFLNNSSS